MKTSLTTKIVEAFGQMQLESRTVGLCIHELKHLENPRTFHKSELDKQERVVFFEETAINALYNATENARVIKGLLEELDRHIDRLMTVRRFS